MTNKLKLQVHQCGHHIPWNSEKALAEALTERAEFLKQHPKLLKFQNEIDRLLDKAGSSENRMIVLAMLMEGNVLELHKQFQNLKRILS
jgi:ubiquinone biosynthesis protein UbiJ